LLPARNASRSEAGGPDGAVPHHSFHVLILGPVTGRIKLEGTLLDLCRIGWGRVKKVTSNKLQVTSKSLILGEKMRLGGEIDREINWNKNIVQNVKEGDWISFHWGQACEILTTQEIKNLEHYTQKTIDLVNAPNR
jgi:hydrogenase maturation factor